MRAEEYIIIDLISKDPSLGTREDIDQRAFIGGFLLKIALDKLQ